MRIMGRYYHLSKKLTEAQSEEIEREMEELEDVASVEITKNHDFMKVITKDNQFAEVMGAAVNICSRVAEGAQLTFARFAFDDKISQQS